MIKKDKVYFENLLVSRSTDMWNITVNLYDTLIKLKGENIVKPFVKKQIEDINIKNNTNYKYFDQMGNSSLKEIYKNMLNLF